MASNKKQKGSEIEQLRQALEAEKAKNEKLSEAVKQLAAPGATPSLVAKVSEKGAVSLYGLGRFPVTLYKSQWERLISEGVKVVQATIAANADKLSEKPKSKREQLRDELLA